MKICECGEGKPHLINGDLIENLEKETNEVKEIYNITKDEENYCKNCKVVLSDMFKACIHCSHAPFIPRPPIGDYYIPKDE